MKKRVFQILDEMNQHDIEHGTKLVQVNNSIVSANKASGGAHITMGAPFDVMMDIMSGKVIAILVVIDSDEYNKRN